MLFVYFMFFVHFAKTHMVSKLFFFTLLLFITAENTFFVCVCMVNEKKIVTLFNYLCQSYIEKSKH